MVGSEASEQVRLGVIFMPGQLWEGYETRKYTFGQALETFQKEHGQLPDELYVRGDDEVTLEWLFRTVDMIIPDEEMERQDKAHATAMQALRERKAKQKK